MLSIEEILLSTTYSLLFAITILKLHFFKKFSLSPKWIAGIFLFKVLAGIGYGLVHYYLYAGGDTFAYFHDALLIRKSITDDPLVFLKLVFGINTRPPDPDILFYAQSMSYWNDMGSYFIIRFHALASLLTFGHYYANVVIYNFLTLIGLLYLFQFFYRFLPEKKYWIAAALFLFPSVTFWSSGIHKDGISLAAIGWILYFTNSLTEKNLMGKSGKKSFDWINLSGLLFGLWLLFVARIYLLLLLTPCLIAFLWIRNFPKYPLLKYLVIFLIFYGIIFSMKWLSPSFDLLTRMVEQQLQFKSSAGTNLVLPSLEPTPNSLMKLIPGALFHCLFYPLPWEIASFIQVSTVIDNIIVLLLVVAACWFVLQHPRKENALMLFSIFFALSVFIFVGVIVPNIGALVRYRMPGVLFLVAGCFSLIELRKIKSFS